MDKNACKNPNVQQQQKQKNHEGAMDKLREVILKLSNSAPSGPLSTTQNSFLQQRLTNFLSSVHTTPDHPPYAWMIEKALKELNEKGGSSEDSISKFIKKEYDSLPWAHMTLVKHHLQKMSEKGEILMIDGGRFLLPDDSESSSPKRKKKRKYVKRKRSGNSEINQRKPRQKEKEEEKHVQHDDVELVGEQKKLEEQQNEVTVNGNHGQENRIGEEYWEMNGQHNEPSTDKEDGQLSGQQNFVTGDEVNDKPDISLLQSPTGFEAVSIDKSSQKDRSQRQLKRWNKSPGDSPKSVSTSEVEPLLPLAWSTREEELNLTDPRHEVHLEQPKQLHRGRLRKYKEDEAKRDNSAISTLATREEALNLTDPRHEVHLEQPKQLHRGRLRKYKEDEAKKANSTISTLATREEALNLTDPQDEVLLEQPKQLHRGRLRKYKEDEAKKDKSTISTLATNEEVVCMDDPEDEVHLKQQKEKRRGRVLRGKEDGADPDTTLLKNLVLSEKLTKKQNGGGLGRRRKAQ